MNYELVDLDKLRKAKGQDRRSDLFSTVSLHNFSLAMDTHYKLRKAKGQDRRSDLFSTVSLHNFSLAMDTH